MQTNQSMASCSLMCTSLTGTSDDYKEMRCGIDQPFQPHDAATINTLAESVRKFMPKWCNSYRWLTVCKSRKKVVYFYCGYAVRHNMLTFSKRTEPTFSSDGLTVFFLNNSIISSWIPSPFTCHLSVPTCTILINAVQRRII